MLTTNHPTFSPICPSTISSNISLHSIGSATAFNLDFFPQRICKSFLGQLYVLDKKINNSVFALPSSGAAVRRIRRRPSLTPANSVFEAPGTAFISSRIVLPSMRKQLFIRRKFTQCAGNCGTGVREKSVTRLIAEKFFVSVFLKKQFYHCFTINFLFIHV